MVKELEFYKGKRVLVTGDTGFKGSWLCLWLKELGADVVGLALPPQTKRDHYQVLGLSERIHHIDGDIRDAELLENTCRKFKPQLLFHLAAQPLVRLSYAEPKLTYDTNVGGSVNVLEAARKTESLRSLIFVTTDKCYKNREWIWGYRETDELGGHDPYSASKAAAELVFASYLKSFFSNKGACGLASVRAGNVIGGGDWSEDRIVPDCIKALQQGEPIVLRNPSATRPWQHVLEPLWGYLKLAANVFAEPQQYSGSWNFGPANSGMHTVEALVQQITMQWGGGEVVVESQKKVLHEAGLLHLNCDKAHFNLQWHSQWGFEKTVQETVGWYQAVLGGMDALEKSTMQIQEFQEGCL
ncbi:CDP-glucose 4,6-dehydratase [Anaeroarcus burkinensis]|uniref:CDP-glucose 4,6-dehydratase n=1 Tax=Anaeroarcus burkinensis TaxID=82376 RepID=UPI000486E2DC|nr:CDP-glucose 4,6-dehydratase [Anaeroarcus burkinensis]